MQVYGELVLELKYAALMLLDPMSAGLEASVRVVQWHASRVATLLPVIP
jgi:hypothetical protein